MTSPTQGTGLLSYLVPTRDAAIESAHREHYCYYQQIEHYIREHSDAEFSNGLCPDCAMDFLDKYQQESGR